MKILTLFILIVLTSCASKSKLSVTTTPESADIIAFNKKTGGNIKIGKTPLIVDVAELKKKNLISGPLTLEIIKSGYQKERVLVTDMGDEDIKLFIKMEKLDRGELAKEYDEVSNDLFKVHNYIRSKNFKLAHEKLSEIIKKNPELSVPYEMKGGLYYLENKWKEALFYFEEALTQNAENQMAKKMKSLIETKRRSR